MSDQPKQPVQPVTTSPTAPTVREAERADAAKTADDAPAPVRAPRERKVLVRDAYGNDPYGESDEIKLGQAPHELPDPLAGALRQAKADADEAAPAALPTPP